MLITHDIDEALLPSERILLLGHNPARTLDEWRIDLPQPRAELVEELCVLRIDFQPYPFPSYTEELAKRLKSTLIEGDKGFLAGLDPQQTARRLAYSELMAMVLLIGVLGFMLDALARGLHRRWAHA